LHICDFIHARVNDIGNFFLPFTKMESGRNEEPKLELDMNDVLSIAKETKSAGLRYVDEALAGKSYSQHEANLIKQQMEQVDL
jgi:hypothetical protein